MIANIVKTSCFLLLFVVCAFAQSEPCDLLKRVVVMGASVSSGFGVTTPPIKGDLGAYPVNMKHIMEGVITSDHEAVKFFGDTLFLRNPKQQGTEFIKQIVEYEPSLVVGIDFLFWFGYGSILFEENPTLYREQKFEFGLELLSRINTPIIVGDLPDMHKAAGKMLSQSQIPSVEVLERLNARLQEWAKEHPNVTVINTRKLVKALMHDKEIKVLDSTWPAGSQKKLLQRDMLHTTLEGTVIASLMVAEATNVDCVETDPKVIMKKAASAARIEAKSAK